MPSLRNGDGSVSEPFIKVRPSETPGRMICEMDQHGAEILERLISRSVPMRQDNPQTHQTYKSRAHGLFMAGRAVVWGRK